MWTLEIKGEARAAEMYDSAAAVLLPAGQFVNAEGSR